MEDGDIIKKDVIMDFNDLLFEVIIVDEDELPL